MVLLVGQLYRRLKMGQRREPAMPEQVAVMERRAMPVGERWSSVRANMMAVEPTVAMASERRNHANRKSRGCERERARRSVEKRDFQA